MFPAYTRLFEPRVPFTTPPTPLHAMYLKGSLMQPTGRILSLPASESLHPFPLHTPRSGTARTFNRGLDLIHREHKPTESNTHFLKQERDATEDAHILIIK